VRIDTVIELRGVFRGRLAEGQLPNLGEQAEGDGFVTRSLFFGLLNNFLQGSDLAFTLVEFLHVLSNCINLFWDRGWLCCCDCRWLDD